MLQEYVKRFATTMQSVDRPSNEVAIIASQQGLQASNFAASLARNPTSSLAKVMNKAYHEMHVEEILEGKLKKVR